MKRIVVIFILSVISIGCASESTEFDTQGFNLPEWLKGEYEGVHTGKYLRISNQNIEFKVDAQGVTVRANDLLTARLLASSFACTETIYVPAAKAGNE